MPATTTTPTSVTGVIASATVTYLVTAATIVTTKVTSGPGLTAVSGVHRLTLPMPIRRWNGTAFVLVYTPKV